METKIMAPYPEQAKCFTKVDIMEFPVYTRLDIIRHIVLVEDICENIGDVLFWCTYGFNESFISGTIKLFAKLEEFDEDRDLGLWAPYSNLCEWFYEKCKLYKGKISRESKYMLYSDHKLLPKAQIEAQRLIESGNPIGAIEITKPIYEKYTDIGKCLSVSKPYGTIFKLYKSQGATNEDSIYEDICAIKSWNYREYMHNNHIFPIDLEDLSYITDFCKFYEEEIAPYQMLYDVPEDKSTPKEYGHLAMLETDRERKYYQRAIEAGYAEEIEGGFLWLESGAQLGYFLCKVYDETICPNGQRPKSKLEALWHTRRYGQGGSCVEKVKSLPTPISRGTLKAESDSVKQWRKDIDEKIFLD